MMVERILHRILAWLAILAITGCGMDPGAAGNAGQNGFRVRSDLAAGLNTDAGWAGVINENAVVHADQPFRIRFVVPAAAGVGEGGFGLQYRRNAGDWIDVEAHDFPRPARELRVDFENVQAGAPPEGWRIAHGNAAGVRVVADAAGREPAVLRAEAGPEFLVGLYTPPWELGEFELATEVRLPAGNSSAAGLVFGYVDAENYCRVLLDPADRTIRVGCLVDGVETILAEERAEVVRERWLQLEIQHEDGALEVNFEDDELEFRIELGAQIPSLPLGFYLPAGGVAEFRDFVIEGEPRTPPVSIVSCPGYSHGEATTRLLTDSASDFEAGVGICLAERTPPWQAGTGAGGEFEWALVVRRLADGALANEEGDTFEFRMVDERGVPVSAAPNPVLVLAVPPGHVGGTFVETPGRIGPWQASNGDLYFIIEPTETDYLFMMIKSTDNGVSWREVDGENRPRTGDLESVDGRLAGGTIHIVHQITEAAFHHAFNTSDHPSRPDTWAVRDELVASVIAVAQAATLVVRSDGSMVAFYVGETEIHHNVRSPAGDWGTDAVLDSGVVGPQAVLGADEEIHLAYYGTDGAIWYRRMRPDGSFTPRQRLATGAGTTEAEFGAVLPLVYIPESNTVVILYRLADGRLWERRVVNGGPPTAAVMVTDREVVRDAVDSQQPGADVVLDGETIHALFIDESSRTIFSTHDGGEGMWRPSTPQVEGIRGSWVRGSVYTRQDGVRVYGYLYDAGSEGGSGMNRFGEIVLSGPE